MKRSRIGNLVAAALLLGLSSSLLPAAGAAPSSMTLVRVEFKDGFISERYRYTQIPSTLLLGERLYLGGVVPAIYPGPAVMPVEERKVNRTAAARRAKAVYDALRTPADGWGKLPVADAPSAVVTVTVNGRTRTATIPAFGIEFAGSGLTEPQASARAALRRALDGINALTGRSGTYRPQQLEAWLLSGSAKQPDLGGDVVEQRGRPGSSGTSGPVDPGVITTESYIEWPSGVTAREGCNVMPASRLPAGANQASMYRSGDGKIFAVAFRPVLPGEKPCQRGAR